MRVCDRCRYDGVVQVYFFGKPDQSYSETRHFELCNECRDKLLRRIDNFISNSEGTTNERAERG